MNMKFYLFLFTCILICGYASAQNIRQVAGMDLSVAYQEYGGIMAGKSVTCEAARVAGVPYTNVIGTHAKSIIKIDTRGNASLFTAQIAIADNKINYQDTKLISYPLVDGKKLWYNTDKNSKIFAGLEGLNGNVEKGSVVFSITGDSRQLYKSPLIRQGDTPIKVQVNLAGVRILEMVVEDGGDGASGDHALWIDPQITYSEIVPVTVSSNFAGELPVMDPQVKRKLEQKIAQLPVVELPMEKPGFDWLVNADKSETNIYRTADNKNIIIANSMVSRVFRIMPNLATIDIINKMTGENMLRAVGTEGTIRIDGKTWNIGGLAGQPERGFLKPEWLDKLSTMPNSFMVEDFEISPLQESIPWARNRWALNKQAPSGKMLTFTLRGTNEHKDLIIKLNIVVYDKIPVIRKDFEIVNQSSRPINIDHFCLEQLAFAEPESPGGGNPDKFRLPNIHVESDYACGGEFMERETDITEKWVSDPLYTSQRNYPMATPCILEVSPPLGPDYTVQPNKSFGSFKTYLMPFDSDDRERKGLFKRRFHYSVAPWATENPIFMHLTSSDPSVIRTAIDQCAETGYEMVIISFGSGLNAEDVSEANLAKYKALVDYGRSKNIELGCYSLLSSRWISDEVDVINPKTGKRGGMRFGSAPCLCSDWGYEYFDKIKTFFQKTGMRCFEHDGSYPGDVCASTTHTHHKGLEDSQWNQFHKITDLYKWMRAEGIYMNVPDFYFLNGTNKTGIGYREANWSLPRDRQIIHARQLNYDGTWDRMASACWSFVPLVEYQGGGAEATLEPLSEHLFEYKTHMIQNYGAGVQACYRGPRLYDTPQTKEMVTEVIRWYKKYRNILNSDIIHLRRPDARDWDGLMHVNPNLKEKGFAMFYNPTDTVMVRTIQLPLYYSGLTQTARVREQEGKPVTYRLDRNYAIELKVTIPANGYTWYVIEQ
ncbi:MAG: NPCBM/NEW2 domain-containing protein [Parabacteroides sp.]|uniref:NPCBM/NEW2 domain-containing protein n=1 Tax=Macellibacteroides sp. TaxID=2014584 RepID=UPI002A0C84A2|nr:NPCBM/NEW2 domain-containing protein [Parabacteroides sp.]